MDTPTDITAWGWCPHQTHRSCQAVSPTAVVRADGIVRCDPCEEVASVARELDRRKAVAA